MARRLAPFVVAACLAIVILLDGSVVPGGMTRAVLMSTAFALGVLLAIGLLDRSPFNAQVAILMACVLTAVWPMDAPTTTQQITDLVCGVLFIVALLLALIGPWERLPFWAQSMPLILASGALLLLRLFAGAPASVAFPLSALFVLWLALHHTRIEMMVGVALSAVTFLLPPFSQALTAELTLGLLYATTNLVIGFSVEMIVRRQREQAGDIEAVEQLLRQIAVGDPDHARDTICSGARQLCGASVAVIFEVDKTGMLVPTAGAGPRIPDLKFSRTGEAFRLDGTPLGESLSGYSTVHAFTSGQPVHQSDMGGKPAVVQRMARDLGSVATLAHPILRNGQAVGVITMAWKQRRRRVPERAAATVALFAAGAAAVLEQADAKRQYRALFDDPQVAIALTGGDGRVLQANRAFLNTFGIKDESVDDLSLLDMTHGDDRAPAAEQLEALRSGAVDQARAERRFLRRDGSILWADIATTTVDDPSGQPSYWQNVLVDITERKQAEELQRLRLAVIQATADATTERETVRRVVTALGETQSWDEVELWLVHGATQGLLLTETWSRRQRRRSRPARRQGATHSARESAAARAWLQRRVVLAKAEIAVPAITDGEVVGVFVFRSAHARDVGSAASEALLDLGARFGEFLVRRRAEAASRAAAKRLEELSMTDPLTGLRNRRAFDRELSAPRRDPYAILAIDLDNLKSINDEHGHEAGDAALRAVADLLSAATRDGDMLARIGGDEFGVLLEGLTLEEGGAVAERMRASTHGVNFAYGAVRISVGCAAGDAATPAISLWRSADAALYSAKRAGRDRVERVAMGHRLGPTRAAADELISRVLATRAIDAVYQPIVDLSSGRMIGFEALARPGGAAPTASVENLFAAARRLGLDRDLDWLCRRAAVQCAHQLPEGLPVFINIGIPLLLDPMHDVDQMLLLLHWARRSPTDVVLEITERDAVHDIRRFEQVLKAYRSEGFRFALDDVGDGHSTFEVLAASMPEFIKIAGGFARLGSHRGRHSAIRAAVTFATDTGAAVIAEGVETDRHLTLATTLGVQLGQGFFLGRPAHAETFAQRQSSSVTLPARMVTRDRALPSTPHTT